MLDAFIKARPAILVRPDKAHEIRRHNVPRHRTIHYELALLDWRRSLALHLCPRSLAFRSRLPRPSFTDSRLAFGDSCLLH